MSALKGYFWIFFKATAMGAANVIPGVSGGTIAFVTGIYERLITALKSLDGTAVILLSRFKFLKFAEHVDLWFLAVVLGGVASGILSLAKVLEFLFEKDPVHIWAFFFGLILASIYFVGKMVKRWNGGPVIAAAAGAAVAVAVALLTPASENEGFLYLVMCGVVVVCSMLVPGLSGSFVLVLMGNYMLVIGAISDVTSALKEMKITDEAVAAMELMVPVGIGCAAGLVAFPHVLGWVFRKHHDIAVAMMTGFIAGSLLLIWPWKNAVYLLDEAGGPLLRKGERIIRGYEWFLPSFDGSALFALALIAGGALAVFLLEKSGGQRERTGDS